MNIYEISEKFGVSMRALRKLEKGKVLKLDPVDPMVDKIVYLLSKSQRLPVDALAHLIENPDVLLELGRHAGEAEYQISSLGNVQRDIAPPDVSAEIEMSAKGDDSAVEKLVAWLQTVIPTDCAVGHHFLAVRLLLSVPSGARPYAYSRLPRALLNVRRHPGFAGWSSYTTEGRHKLSQYHRPAENFDL